MKTMVYLIGVLSAVMRPAVAQVAQESHITSRRTLTLEEAISIGLDHSRTLHSSLMKAEYADAKSSEVSASLYPSLKAQVGYQRLSDIPPAVVSLPPGILPGGITGIPISPVILNNYTAKATLQQPLFTGWKLQGAADNAGYTASAAHSDYNSDKEALLYDIKSAYWRVYRSREVRRLADDAVQQISQHLEDIQNMLKQGMATDNEVLKTKVQLSNAKVAQSDAENGVRIAVLSLNSIIGLPLNTDIEIASTLRASQTDFPDLEQLLASAFDRRPEVQAMQWRMKAAEAGITTARSGWLPQIFLTGDYYYSRPNQRIFPAVDRFKDSWDVGINLQIDIWNNLTTVHQTGEAKAQYEQVKDAFSVLKDGITLEVTQSYFNFTQAKQKVELAQLSVEQANENLRVTREKFKAGLTTNSEMLDAEVAQQQAKLQMVQSQVDSELATARLEKAVGESK